MKKIIFALFLALILLFPTIASCFEPSPIEISIKTEKAIYNIKEEIRLTDPPEMNPSPDESRTQSMENKAYLGYIVQLYGEPLVKQSNNNGNDAISLPRAASAKKIYATGMKKADALPAQNSQIAKKGAIAGNALESEHKNAINDIARILGREPAIMGEYYKVINAFALDISDAEAEKVEHSSYVKKISPNYRTYPMMDKAVKVIGADKAWLMNKDAGSCSGDSSTCITGKGVTIAILDSGVQKSHPDLTGKVAFENDFVPAHFDLFGIELGDGDDDKLAQDDNGHGTHVAATAAGKGILKGVAPDANIAAGKVLGGNGGMLSWTVSAIEWAIDPNGDMDFSDRFDVISMSLGAGTDFFESGIEEAADNAMLAGSVVVIAAGNSGPQYYSVTIPGTARKAITVGATYTQDYAGYYWQSKNPRKDDVAHFSSAGPTKSGIMKPDISAPGALICAARMSSFEPWKINPVYQKCIDDKHVLLAGTSMATPIVSGAAALIIQAHPDWAPERIKEALMQQSGGNYNPLVSGYGRLNIANVISNPNMPYDDYTSIESPGEVGGKYSIIGKIKRDGFLSYKIEIGKSQLFAKEVAYSTAFSSTAMPSGQYLASNLNPPLGYGLNVIKLTVQYVSHKTVRYSYLFNRKGQDFELLPGWPKSPHEWVVPLSVGSTPIIHDLDGKGGKEIITYSFDRVNVWTHDGSYFPGWPKVIDGIITDDTVPPPSIGDIDGDGSDEIVRFSNWNFERGAVKVCGYAWEIDGSPVKGWTNSCPTKTLKNAGESLLYNIDSDAGLEIFIRPFDEKTRDTIYIIKGNGDIYRIFTYPGKNVTFPAVDDIDNDETVEMAVITYDASGAKLTVYSILSRAVEGSFSVPMPKEGDPVILLDIDGDEQKEIGYIDFEGNIRFYEKDGSVVPGWPFMHSGKEKKVLSATSLGGNNLVFSYFDRNEGNFVAVLEPGGRMAQGWPQRIYGSAISVRPQSVDVTGDKKADIITTTDAGLIYAWEANGELVAGFPIEMGADSQSGTAFDDVDGDERLEMFAGVSDGTLFGWKLNVKVDDASMKWPMWKQNPRNTGILEGEKFEPPVKSMIKNTGKESIEGELVLKVQKLTKLGWVDYRIVSNDDTGIELGTSRIILPGEYIALDKIWNAQNVRIPEMGLYRAYAGFVSGQLSWFASQEFVVSRSSKKLPLVPIDNTLQASLSDVSGNGLEDMPPPPPVETETISIKKPITEPINKPKDVTRQIIKNIIYVD